MTQPLITDRCTAGALIRRYLRANLDELGMRWVEHKGWLSSEFVITGTLEQWEPLLAWYEEIETARESRRK